MTRRETPVPAPAPPRVAERHVGRHDDRDARAISTLLARFGHWFSQWNDDASRWVALDQFLRGQLYDTLQAERVRCFRVSTDGSVLEPLTPSTQPFERPLSARNGLFGHVLTTGTIYHLQASDSAPTLRKLAAATPDPPAWCFPILRGLRRVGLVSVGSMPADTLRRGPLLEALARVINLIWDKLIDHEELAIARQTDQGTGVLTRANFFKVAEDVLAESYEAHEPCVILAATLEGVRRLDDLGLWELRDSVVACAGQVIRRRVRSDDIVGRFADDRFVAILRRLDTSLGRLIAEKLIEAIKSSLDALTLGQAPINLRCAIVGTPDERPTPRELISRAFALAEQAREAGSEEVAQEPGSQA